jgi:hypothetical protein
VRRAGARSNVSWTKPLTCRIVASVILGSLMCGQIASAGSISMLNTRTEISGGETLDWSGFGPADTDVPSNSMLTTASGIVVTVTQPSYGMQIRQEGLPANLSGSWTGDFLPGQALLTNWNSPFAVTLSFSQPIFAAGVQIEPGQVQDLPASFTAYVIAYDGDNIIGQFSTDGVRSISRDGSAPFLGVADDLPEITSLTYRIIVETNGPSAGDLGMNFLSLESSAPSPEPSSWLYASSALIAAIAYVRRSRRSR